MKGYGNRDKQPEHKVCSDCGVQKNTLLDFYWATQNSFKWPLKRCKSCHITYTSSRRNKNKEQYKKYNKVYREKNFQKIKESLKKYRSSDEYKQKRRILRGINGPWHKKHIDEAKLRRARKLSAITSESVFVTNYWFNELCKTFNYQCSYCFCYPFELTQDHIVPLSKGGTHTRKNIVPSCRSCNSSKNNKLIKDWKPEVVVPIYGLELSSA